MKTTDPTLCPACSKPGYDFHGAYLCPCPDCFACGVQMFWALDKSKFWMGAPYMIKTWWGDIILVSNLETELFNIAPPEGDEWYFVSDFERAYYERLAR